MTIKPKTFDNLINACSEYNEPQWWMKLSNGRSLEVTHKEHNLKTEQQYYIARIHCSNTEWTSRKYDDTLGIIAKEIFYKFDYYEITKWSDRYNN